MSVRQGIDDARSREVPWDDLRERRVLARLEAARAAGPAPAPRRPWLAVALAGAASLALAVGAVLAWPRAPERTPLAVPTVEPASAAPTATPVIPHVDPARLTLADGSIAWLGEAARVQVTEQSPARVAMHQASGRVRYEVVPNHARRFVVAADDVEVRVLGTIFVVDIVPSHVTVEVERGVVEVAAGERLVRLEVGDTLQVPRAAADDDEPIIVDDDTVARAGGRNERPRPAPPAPAASPSAEELLDRADRARASGDAAVAAAALRELVAAHPTDPRAVAAWFQLGKVERARDRAAASARAFERCVAQAPHGALAEDARAQAAISWEAAGDDAHARRAAQAYLDRYPSGTHADRMRHLLAAAP